MAARLMSTALMTRSILPGELHEDGIALPADLTFDQWAAALSVAETIERASPWWVADLVAFGEDHFGEEHTQAFPTAEDDPTGDRQAKLKQAGWMASKFPPGTRVPGLSYTHHRVVAKLDRDEARGLLEVAGAQRWSTRELAREVEARANAVRAEAMVATQTGCAADAPWEPTLADLDPATRREVEAAAPDGEIAREWFVSGVLWSLRYAGNEALFAPGAWRD